MVQTRPAHQKAGILCNAKEIETKTERRVRRSGLIATVTICLRLFTNRHRLVMPAPKRSGNGPAFEAFEYPGMTEEDVPTTTKRGCVT